MVKHYIDKFCMREGVRHQTVEMELQTVTNEDQNDDDKLYVHSLLRNKE